MEKEINILLLEKRGCDFWKDDEEMNKYSDIGNYRVFCKGLKIKGITTYIDFGRTYKREFKKDKNGNVKGYKNIHQHLLKADTYQHIYDKDLKYYQCFRNCEIEKETYKYSYTLDSILKYVNKINDFKIEKVLIFDNIYNKIEDIAGYREKAILECCNKIALVQDDNNYQVFRFYGEDEQYFDYEVKSNRITG
ncbi:MAG: hypothetical protein HFJ48_01345 [Clostridia bacterium]|nr:hypothetical protein [Clostridia bacterium]